MRLITKGTHVENHRRFDDKEEIAKDFLGFTFAPELSNQQEGGRYSLMDFHSRSRSLNAAKSPANYREGFYAADYKMKIEGTRVSYQSVLEEDYHRENTLAGHLLFGDPALAGEGTLSDSIEDTIKRAVIRGLATAPQYNDPTNRRTATAIHSLARAWGERIRAPARAPAATTRLLQRRPQIHNRVF
jgi:hypothetical protein